MTKAPADTDALAPSREATDMAHNPRLRPPDDDIGYLPAPPRTGAARFDWFRALDNAISIDILSERIKLRDAGLTPAQVEGFMIDYRLWITGRIGTVCDLFAAELVWGAS